MASNQTTVVQLLAVPLENDYLHTYFFDSLEAQYNFFSGKVIFTENNLSYQRKDNVIRFPKHFDDLQVCNYVRYRNGSKWYYAFITEMKYVNEERTDITIETDVMQTWLFDYTVKPSFVEREHVPPSLDVMGAYTQEEGLQIGDYVCNLHQQTNLGSAFKVVLAVSKRAYAFDTDGTIDTANGGVYNGIYSGLQYLAFPYEPSGIEYLYQTIRQYDALGIADDIHMMFLLPSFMLEMDGDGEIATTVKKTDKPKQHYINTYQVDEDYSMIHMSDAKLNGYTPRNKKLLSHPYRYLMVSNNNGVAVPYQYEHFKTTILPTFVIEGCITPGGSIRMVPLNYKGIDRNDEEGINLGKYPILNWTSDAYTNWMTQNSVNIGIDIASTLATTAIGIAAAPATGGLSLAGAVVSGATGIASTMAEIRKASLIPNHSRGNINSGDIVAASGQNDFHFYDMTIKAEYAKILDKYFDMFGYKVNDVKIPETNHRPHYWFTKTQDVGIQGAIPKKDLQTIKNCYNKGITFWKNHDNLGDYSLNNR